MSILIDKNTRVITQGITGKTGQFHTRACREYANGAECFVAGVNPRKAGRDFEGIPIFGSVREAKQATGANVSVIYVPPAGAAAAIWEAAEAELDLAICITEGIPVRDMIEVRDRMRKCNSNSPQGKNRCRFPFRDADLRSGRAVDGTWFGAEHGCRYRRRSG